MNNEAILLIRQFRRNFIDDFDADGNGIMIFDVDGDGVFVTVGKAVTAPTGR